MNNKRTNKSKVVTHAELRALLPAMSAASLPKRPKEAFPVPHNERPSVTRTVRLLPTISMGLASISSANIFQEDYLEYIPGGTGTTRYNTMKVISVRAWGPPGSSLNVDLISPTNGNVAISGESITAGTAAMPFVHLKHSFVEAGTPYSSTTSQTVANFELSTAATSLIVDVTAIFQ